MRLLGCKALFAALWLGTRTVSVWALHESDVGLVDWTQKLVGVPIYSSPLTAPVFHGDLILMATSANVLAGVNATDGSVVWRSIYDAEDPIMSYTDHGDTVSTLSGPGGATLRAYDANDGALLLEKRLHDPLLGKLHDPGNLGTRLLHLDESGEAPSETILALTNGYTVHSLDATTGETRWTWVASDQGSLIIHTHLLADPKSSTLFVAGLAKSTASFTLHVTALSLSTGEELTSHNIPANLADARTDYVALTGPAGTGGACLSWLEKGVIKVAVLKPDLKGSVLSIPGAKYKRVEDIGLAMNGQYLAYKEDGAGQVMHFDAEKGVLKAIWEFPESASSSEYSESTYAGAHDAATKDPRVVRAFWSNKHNRIVHQVFAADVAADKATNAGYVVPFDTSEHGVIRYALLDGSSTSEMETTRVLLITSTGAVQLWKHNKLQWTREEALSTIQVAEFVELPERKVAGTHVDDDEGYVSMLRRQLGDAKNLPHFIISFIRRFATGSYASVSSSASPSLSEGEAASHGGLSRDTFGFRQVIVAATSYGKLYGIDSSSGRILWSRVLGLGWAAKVGGRIIPVKIYTTRTVADAEGPRVVVVTQRRADNTLVDTVVFHIDPLTGEDAKEDGVPKAQRNALEGKDSIAGPLMETFLVPDGNKTVLLLDEFLQARLYPETPATQKALEEITPSLYFMLRAGEAGARQLVGHQLTAAPDLSEHLVGYPTWTLPLQPHEEILSVLPPTQGPIASVGKVLGNRATLYKYLNPHMRVVLTALPIGDKPSCGVYVVDGVKGSIVYNARVPAAGGRCDVHASLTENWLVYHYYDDESAGVPTTTDSPAGEDTAGGAVKGWRVVSVEIYEGQNPDDKTSSSDLSAFSSASLHGTAIETSFITTQGITAIASTSTKFGVTTKDIIIATKKHSIQAIPRRLLDPRRPHHKPTAEEIEEMLVQYDPVLPDDPRLVLSHNYEVANVRQIVTAPSLLESTTLVFAFGLDLFCTRIAPSNTFDVLSEGFNKVQLVLTILGLTVAIAITKPMVRRKRLRERWYQ
ncbi:DUF1620-domain-containing protein [Coniophora puteana RWD-64-598 SS2]|uniref:ER membrane protein complex subunit 1 n=1 Tax=Coniophora puteana (strain RWD-64-598) TaxID=741705 RepID=A0A5M3M7V8_CONPW|nr:DUF1620-domain-containing protein [Coniophora puteana RWD-64-598 SS2]EIW74996.1 DUF1620-domain-containing protein [Coniophora puteana RWD-64-598 SS2]